MVTRGVEIPRLWSPPDYSIPLYVNVDIVEIRGTGKAILYRR
jgi:hypothetical protein